MKKYRCGGLLLSPRRMRVGADLISTKLLMGSAAAISTRLDTDAFELESLSAPSLLRKFLKRTWRSLMSYSIPVGRSQQFLDRLVGELSSLVPNEILWQDAVDLDITAPTCSLTEGLQWRSVAPCVGSDRTSSAGSSLVSFTDSFTTVR